MKGFIRWIKELFGIYENDSEYYVNFDDIEITPQFMESKPGFKKLNHKFDYYLRTGRFESPIVLTKDFVLIDGYTSYLIAEAYGLDRVPVYFQEGR